MHSLKLTSKQLEALHLLACAAIQTEAESDFDEFKERKLKKPLGQAWTKLDDLHTKLFFPEASRTQLNKFRSLQDFFK